MWRKNCLVFTFWCLSTFWLTLLCFIFLSFKRPSTKLFLTACVSSFGPLGFFFVLFWGFFRNRKMERWECSVYYSIYLLRGNGKRGLEAKFRNSPGKEKKQGMQPYFFWSCLLGRRGKLMHRMDSLFIVFIKKKEYLARFLPSFHVNSPPWSSFFPPHFHQISFVSTFFCFFSQPFHFFTPASLDLHCANWEENINILTFIIFICHLITGVYHQTFPLHLLSLSKYDANVPKYQNSDFHL